MRPKLYFISKYFSILFQFNLNLFQKFLKIYFHMILEILDKTPPLRDTPEILDKTPRSLELRLR
jgi:hypothetical protein